MTDIPKRRRDGLCIECEKKTAETRCGRWCRGCLRKLINEQVPIDNPKSEQYGRPAVSIQAIAGTTDMRTIEEQVEDAEKKRRKRELDRASLRPRKRRTK